MTETWLPIPGYEVLYEVSDLARVRSLDHMVPHRAGGLQIARGRLLKPYPSTFGHPSVNLSKDGVRKYFGVHQLVLLAFVGQRPAGMVTRHLDGNAADSRLCNLAYGTPAENSQDAVRHGHNPQANKTHCDNGHEFTEANLWRYRNQRFCRTCKRETNRLSEERRRRAAGVTGEPKSHCRNGHPFSGDNLFTTAKGTRGCRACMREYDRVYREKKKAATA